MAGGFVAEACWTVEVFDLVEAFLAVEVFLVLVVFLVWEVLLVVVVVSSAARGDEGRRIMASKRAAVIPTANLRPNDRPVTTIAQHYRKGWLFRATNILLPPH